MEILLAAASALVYGTGDFFGGLASRRLAPLVVTAASQMIGLALLVVVAPLWPHPELTGADWGWGALGGLCGAVGLSMFYAALARGPMAVVAPVTALVSALVPVAVGVVGGDRPAAVAWVGVALAMPAIALVASGTELDGTRLAPVTAAGAVVAGLGFGGFFVSLAQTHAQAGMVPLLAARLASVSVLVVALAVRRQSPRPDRGSRTMVAATGAFDVLANGLYLRAISQGMLSTVAVVSAMYPASTVVLARFVLGERLSVAQRVGLVCAATSVALVAVAS